MAQIIYYPISLNAYNQKNIKEWSLNNGLKYVVEIHFNAFNKTAQGTENWIYSGYAPDPVDRELVSALASNFNLINRGTKGTNQLANVVRMANSNIGYCLLETHFGDNSSDHSKMQDVRRVGGVIKQVLDKYYSGNTKVGIVYGHGQGDSGAIASNGQQEQNYVRSIKVETATTPPPTYNPTKYQIPIYVVNNTKDSGIWSTPNVNASRYGTFKKGSPVYITHYLKANNKTWYCWLANGKWLYILEDDFQIFKLTPKAYPLKIKAIGNAPIKLYPNLSIPNWGAYGDGATPQCYGYIVSQGYLWYAIKTSDKDLGEFTVYVKDNMLPVIEDCSSDEELKKLVDKLTKENSDLAKSNQTLTTKIEDIKKIVN